ADSGQYCGVSAGANFTFHPFVVGEKV
ncbi:unnamed protein product, partial [Allacma fusca]